MKVKTSVTLEKGLLQEIAVVGGGESRSEFIETAVIDRIRRMKNAARDLKETKLIDKHVTSLNSEAKDVLGYQVGL